MPRLWIFGAGEGSFRGIISIFLDSRERKESIETIIVSIGYANVFRKVTEITFASIIREDNVNLEIMPNTDFGVDMISIRETEG